MAQALEAIQDSFTNTAHTHHITIPPNPSTITHARTFCKTAIVELQQPMTRRATTVMGIPTTTTTTTMDATSMPAITIAAALPAACVRFLHHTFQPFGGSGLHHCSGATFAAVVRLIRHATTTTGTTTAATTTTMDIPAITISSAVPIISMRSCIMVYKSKSRLGLSQIAFLLIHAVQPVKGSG